jgi:hypothetical protein
VHLVALEADYRKVRDLDDTAEAERRVDNIEAFALAPPLVAFGGAALTTAAAPFVLPHVEDGRLPTLAWIAGGAGVAFAGVGTYFLVSGGSCERFDMLGRCDDVPSTTRLGAMLLSTSLPLISIPIVYWARGWGASDSADIALDVSNRHLFLSWRGTL